MAVKDQLCGPELDPEVTEPPGVGGGERGPGRAEWEEQRRAQCILSASSQGLFWLGDFRQAIAWSLASSHVKVGSERLFTGCVEGQLG